MDDSLPTTYTVTWTINGTNSIQSHTLIEQSSYTITGLTLDTAYTITVTASNRCGTGPEYKTSFSFPTDITFTTSSISTAGINPVTTTSTENPSATITTTTTTTTDTTTALTTAATTPTNVVAITGDSSVVITTAISVIKSTTTPSAIIMPTSTSEASVAYTPTISIHVSPTMTVTDSSSTDEETETGKFCINA